MSMTATQAWTHHFQARTIQTMERFAAMIVEQTRILHMFYKYVLSKQLAFAPVMKSHPPTM
jgi:hypothetical protein